jgi:LPXTG-motif cell wall-anchored protein
MKFRRLLLVAFLVLTVTALSAAVASAQDGVQESQSADLILPTNTTGEFDTGDRQMNLYRAGETSTNSSRQAVPQPEQPAEKGARNNRDGAMPKAAPSSGADQANPADGGAPAPTPPSQPKAELPKTGGPSNGSLLSLGAGTLLVAAGLLARKIVK